MLLGQGTLVGDATPEMIQAAIAQVAGEEADAVINLAVGAAAGGAPFAVSADVIMSSTNATEARTPPFPLSGRSSGRGSGASGEGSALGSGAVWGPGSGGS